MIGVEGVEHAQASQSKGRQRVITAISTFRDVIDLAGRLPLVFALFMCVGSIVYFTLPFEPETWSVFIAFGLVSVLFWSCLRAGRALIFAVIGFGLVSGFFAGKIATLRVAHPVIETAMGPVMLEGWVEEIEPAERGVRLRLLVHAVDGQARRELPKHIRVTHTAGLKVESGRFVRCWVVLRPPPASVMRGDYAFDRQAWYEGLGAVGYVQGRCRGGALGPPNSMFDRWRLKIAEGRRALAYYVNEAAGERAGGFAAAVSSGDRSFMAEADKEALRKSGLAHLLAISGLHMGIVGGLVFVIVWRGLALIEPLALRITVRKPAAASALIVSFVYLILSGASVSTQRAFIMALVFFGAVLFDRTALSMRSVAIAMILVVAIAPWSVLSPGFQMSFAATGVLIMTYEVWQKRRRAEGLGLSGGAWFWTKSIVVTSLVTSLATVPFALYHFDRMAPLGLIANVLAMPIVSLVSAPLAGLALVTAPLGLADWPLRAFGWSLEAILWIGGVFSDVDGFSGKVGKPMPDSALILFSIALVLGLIGRNWRGRLAMAIPPIAFGLLSWAFASSPSLHFAPSGEIFLLGDKSGPQRLQFADGEGLAPLRYSNLAEQEVCSGDQNCLITHDGLTLGLVSVAGITDCRRWQRADIIFVAEAVARESICNRLTYTLRDAELANGLSFVNRSNGLKLIKKPDCRARPWRTCP
ncbi:MAG: ComEC/Rec2 family competence protein [Pseudomonadota bacterium]